MVISTKSSHLKPRESPLYTEMTEFSVVKGPMSYRRGVIFCYSSYFHNYVFFVITNILYYRTCFLQYIINNNLVKKLSIAAEL